MSQPKSIQAYTLGDMRVLLGSQAAPDAYFILTLPDGSKAVITDVEFTKRGTYGGTYDLKYEVYEENAAAVVTEQAEGEENPLDLDALLAELDEQGSTSV